MGIVEQEQLRRVRALLACCRGGGGPLEAYDAAAAALPPADAGLALRELGRLVRAAEERQARLEAVAGALEELARAAAYRAVVLELLRGEGAAPLVYLAILGQPTRVVAGFLPEAKTDELRVGDEVEVVQAGPQLFAVRRRVGPHLRAGGVARVEECLGGDLLRVRRGPDPLVLRASPALLEQAGPGGEPRALIGRLVSYDAELGLAFSSFGPPEREELVLREFPRVARDELILDEDLVDLLEHEVLLPRRERALADRLGVAAPRCLVLEGPPGVGKTHAARWLASELGLPVFLISGAELADRWYGGSEARLRARLAAAQAEPGGAVLCWDEADALIPRRGTSLSGVEDRLVSILLSHLDGFARSGDGLLVLTTNRADRIDAALLRPLRALPVAFGRPDAKRTRALFRLYLRGVECAGEDAEALAAHGARLLFAASTPLADAVRRDGVRVPIPRAAAASGALVRAACERARRLAFVRAARGDGLAGVSRRDLALALEESLARTARTLTRENAAQMVSLPPEAERDLAAIEPVRTDPIAAVAAVAG